MKFWKRLLISISILVIIFSVFHNSLIQNTENFTDTDPKILFTCTTYISKPGKLESLKQTLDSFLKYTPKEKLNRMVVINEYAENTEESIYLLENKYTQIDFINKTEKDKGQARSVNMIIDLLREGNYDYWIHWEDSWILKKPFISDAIDILKDNKVDQLQLIPRWKDVSMDRKKNWTTKSGKKYIEILKINDSIDDQLKPFGTCKDYKLNWWENNHKNWPLFSLSPGIDKVDSVLKTGYFDTSPELWPIVFEFKWSVKWLCNGARKAVLDNAVCERVENHISTYG